MKKLCISLLSLVLGLATHAFALRGELKEPGLTMPQGFPQAARDTITASLTRPDCKFLGGVFVNEFTTLKYGGETVALNLFLEGLVKNPGVSISVRFQSEEMPGDCDWYVSHSADKPRDFMVRVNMKSARIKMENLVIPEAKGPPEGEK